MALFSDLPLGWAIVVFGLAAGVIALAGTRLARTADQLADLTGLGEAFFGAVLLGGSTSLAGITTSMVGALLATLLAIPLLSAAAPPVTVWAVHPASLALVAAYLFGLHLVREAGAEPLWLPRLTLETRPDEATTRRPRGALPNLWLRFVGLGLAMAGAGWVVARTGIVIVERTGLSETAVGTLLTAVGTSLPELVTSLAAVRQGALTLAVGGVLGGNAFDVLFLAFADVAFREGSIYHAATQRQVFVIALAILLTGTVLLGLLRRERKGIGGIGFESFLVLLLYLGGALLITFAL